MKKVLLVVSMFYLFFAVAANVFACDNCSDDDVITCDGPGCYAGELSSGTVIVNAAGDTYGYGDEVKLLSQGETAINAQFGDPDQVGDNVAYQSAGAWLAINEGAGNLGAGGEIQAAMQYEKMDVWGVDRVLVDGGANCEDGCLPEYFDATMFNADGATRVAAYGKEVDVGAVTLLTGKVRLGDPSDNNSFEFAELVQSQSSGQDFKEVLSGANAAVDYFKSSMDGSIKVSIP